MKYAAGWAKIACEVLETKYPYGAQHASHGPDDVDVTPDRLHPAFYGSYDWHSSAHMQWSLVRLLALAPDQVGQAPIELLDRRLTDEAIATEAAYLRDRPSYERPYGWAWAAMLVAAAHKLPQASRWADALTPLGETIADLVLGWLPRQAYPVRHGVHLNSAFALALLLEAYDELGRTEVVDTIRSRAIEWFGEDTSYDTRFEPSGTDFLSPAPARGPDDGRLRRRPTRPPLRTRAVPSLATSHHRADPPRGRRNTPRRCRPPGRSRPADRDRGRLHVDPLAGLVRPARDRR